MSLKRLTTGVFLTAEELAETKKRAAGAQLEFPADLDKGPIPYPEGPWLSLATYVHNLALEKGLPDLPGFYGVDVDGQFVTYSDMPDFEEEKGD